MNAEAKLVLRSPVALMAFGFGSGLIPKISGTAGTLAALPFAYYLLSPWFGTPEYIGFLVLTTLIGIPVCGYTSRKLNVHDHRGIVWDEFVGMWIALALIPANSLNWITLAGGFVLFRFFDILKPWPIRLLDRRVHGGLGIMLDDVVAGLFAMPLTWVVYWFTI